jgi:hypothetical protein
LSVLLRGEPEFDLTGEEQSQFGKDLARLNSFAGSGTDEGSQPHWCKSGTSKDGDEHFARRILTTTLTTKGADAGAKCGL